jgi:hypothetical protein
MAQKTSKTHAFTKFFKKNSSKHISVDVIIFTEATYPYVKGGVSTVIHQIIDSHPQMTFGVIFIGWQSNQSLKSKYPELSQLKWVDTIFLNQSNSKFSFKNILKKYLSFKNQKNCRKILYDFRQIIQGNIQKFFDIYDNFINPQSRKLDFFSVASGPVLFKELFMNLKEEKISLNELYWLKNDFLKILHNLTDHVYPTASVYHSHTQGYAGFAASIAALQNKRNFFLTEHSLYLKDVRQYLENDFNKSTFPEDTKSFYLNAWSLWFELIGKWNYQRAKKISYLYSKISEEAFLLGSKKDVTTIIPNGINFSDFEEARNNQKINSLNRFQNDHQWIFSLVGRIVPVKGILDIIETAHFLKLNWDKNFIFELVGPFDEDLHYFHDCQKKVNELNLNKHVFFLGPQKVQEYLSKPDLVILSSHSEALPMAALEGMACGLPIISTDVGSVRDIIQDPLFSCGLICPPKNPIILAQQIMRVSSDQKLYNLFSQNALIKVKQSYDFKNVMNCYGTIYKELSKSNDSIEEELYA